MKRPIHINENIKYYREQFGITQEELAAKINVSKYVMNRYETDKHPRIEHALQIANLFGITLEELIF